MSYITRIAPSPSGPMHIGTARTALFNWMAARASGGEFVLRIDDTNAELSKEEHVDSIKRGLEWLGLDWDREVRQSSDEIIDQCVAEEARLSEFMSVEDGAGVFSREYDEDAWSDWVVGEIKISDQLRDDASRFVIRRADGGFTYHFASVVSDIAIGTTLVIRGHDHINNTAFQRNLYRALGVEPPEFAHVGLIYGPDGKKYSKRTGSPDILKWKEGGIHPDAAFNLLLRLGWAPSVDNKENSLTTRERSLELFLDGGKMKGVPAKFDSERLGSFNRKIKSRLQAGEWPCSTSS